MKTQEVRTTTAPGRGRRGQKLRGMMDALSSFWNEFRRYRFGVFGLICFLVFVLLVIFEPLIIPFRETNTRWRDITYWEDNPVNAQPIWVNLFTSKKMTPQQTIRNGKEKVQEETGVKFIDTTFTYNFKYNVPPTDLAFHANVNGDATFVMSVVRPDGKEVKLFETQTSSSVEQDYRVAVGKAGSADIFEFARQYEDQSSIALVDRTTFQAIESVFAVAKKGILINPTPMKGEYRFKLTAALIGYGEIKDMRLVVAGRAYGILGTDSSKRDVWSGLIAGTKWALLIGLLTSLVSVIIGVLYGVASAYFGGIIDSILMRIYEVVSSIPLLPVFIVVSAIFKPSIWTMIIMMCLFFWTGSVRTVRSMGLQIREETYVEAAHALNASSARIIFRHMLPQLIPFSFASMALSVPSAILYEASVSLLGLGDATIVTWGQILHDAMAGGAVLQGLWWWVVPPGLFIALMGMTFAFIGFAMDTILNPKLRTR